MLDHVSVHVTDFAKAKEFYLKALAPLGYGVIKEYPEYSVAGFGEKGNADVWISVRESAAGHIALVAPSKDAVDQFHKAGLEAGGKDNGAPGYRTDYAPNYYAAFVHDPDGNNIEVVFHDPAR